MTLNIATLLGFIILGCFTATKTLLAFVALAALFYASLPAVIGLLTILSAIHYFPNEGEMPCMNITC
ncbi:hypothetical protein [Dechloromonas denitrificans]|uniref:hypothetical protein n=1 Tax=Dechloromonas denitrificans TaxID=281362 RepID=UPI001CF9A144|nr:hypothetical protein [Dechloromonas denitrificans]UCV07207.1 hypothetical protein KI615_17650 [Dechloromonas denitrificans]